MFAKLERATAFNPVCTSTYTFDRPIDIAALREALHEQCEVFPKYRQKLSWRGGCFQIPKYEDDPNFHLDRHFEVKQLPEPAGPGEMNDFVSILKSAPGTFGQLNVLVLNRLPNTYQHRGMRLGHYGPQSTWRITMMTAERKGRWFLEATTRRPMARVSLCPLCM